VEEEHLTFERNAVPPVVTVKPLHCEHIPGKPRIFTEKESGKSIIDFCMGHPKRLSPAMAGCIWLCAIRNA
jgi:hypothetical protein